MKICFVTTGDIKDIATSKRALGMANYLNELDWEVHILMEDATENKNRVALECSSSIRIHYYTKCGAINEIFKKNRLIKEIQPDYLYVCAFVIRNIVGIGEKTKKLVEHSELQSGIPDLKGFKKYITNFLEFYSIDYADGLLCASKYLEKVYRDKSKFFKSKTPIMYFPYAFSENLCKPKQISKIPQNISKLKDKRNFLFLGSITRNYGIFTMLEAFRQLLIKQNDIRLILLGKGRHYKDAIEYVKFNQLEDAVLLPGFVEEEDISNYFSIATAFLSPMNNTVQDWARCPSKLYMYLPFNKPIITCKIGEPFEVLGESGVYYESGNASSLAEVCIELISNNNQESNMNINAHTWYIRVKEFDDWIKSSFIVK